MTPNMYANFFGGRILYLSLCLRKWFRIESKYWRALGRIKTRDVMRKSGHHQLGPTAVERFWAEEEECTRMSAIALLFKFAVVCLPPAVATFWRARGCGVVEAREPRQKRKLFRAFHVDPKNLKLFIIILAKTVLLFSFQITMEHSATLWIYKIIGSGLIYTSASGKF